MFSITHKGTASSTSQYEINSANHCPSAVRTTFRHIKVTANEPRGGERCARACRHVQRTLPRASSLKVHRDLLSTQEYEGFF